MLPTPGNVTAMPLQTNPAEAALPGTAVVEEIAPPLPGAVQGGPPPLPGAAAPVAVSQAYHQPTELNPPPLGEPADVTVVETVEAAIPQVPAPIGSVAPPLPGASAPPHQAVAEPVIHMPPEAATVVVPAAAAVPLVAATPPPVAQAAPVAQVAPVQAALPTIPPAYQVTPDVVTVVEPPAQVAPAVVTVVEPVATALVPAPTTVPLVAGTPPPVAMVPTTMVPTTMAPPAATAVLAGMQQPAQLVPQDGVLPASDGFEDMEIGFGSFPIVTLKETTFNTSDGDTLGQTFVCIIHHRRKKLFYKCRDDNDAEEMFYSYDGVTTATGKVVAEIIAEWAAKGWTQPLQKEYSEVTAQLVDLQKKELGNVVLLSIPNNSNPRLAGYRTTVVLKGLKLNQVITQIYPGQRVTSGKKPFYPWAFKEYERVANLFR